MEILRAKKASNKRKNYGFYRTTIKSLPPELLSEVLARVASASMTDLYTAKTCCRDFFKVAEEDYIYQNVSMDKIPFIPWFITNKLSSFLKRCKESGNPESIYREGMVEFFSTLKMDSGIEKLKEAAQKGHREAKYVYGMILICCEDEDWRKEGVKVLGLLRMSKCVRKSRKKVECFIGSMWINNRAMFLNHKPLCNSKSCNGLREIARLKTGWPLKNEEDEDISCELCRWDYEVDQFSKKL